MGTVSRLLTSVVVPRGLREGSVLSPRVRRTPHQNVDPGVLELKSVDRTRTPDPHQQQLSQSRSRLKSEAARTGHRRNVLERQLPPGSAEMKDAVVRWRWFSDDVSEALDSTSSDLCRGEDYEVVTRARTVRTCSVKITDSRKIPRSRTAHLWSIRRLSPNCRQGGGIPAGLVGCVVTVSGPMVKFPCEHHEAKSKHHHSDAENRSARQSSHHSIRLESLAGHSGRLFGRSSGPQLCSSPQRNFEAHSVNSVGNTRPSAPEQMSTSRTSQFKRGKSW